MKPLIFALVLPLLPLLGCQPSPEKAAIERQLQDYPESRGQSAALAEYADDFFSGSVLD